jgi:hypothetical protein
VAWIQKASELRGIPLLGLAYDIVHGAGPSEERERSLKSMKVPIIFKFDECVS